MAKHKAETEGGDETQGRQLNKDGEEELWVAFENPLDEPTHSVDENDEIFVVNAEPDRMAVASLMFSSSLPRGGSHVGSDGAWP